MRDTRLFSLSDAKTIVRQVIDHAPPVRDWHHEALVDHAYQTGTATRQRVRLVAKGLAKRVHESSSEVKKAGRDIIRGVGASAALRLSKKLHEVASKIESKANKIKAAK